jgi:hypothetical protein
MGIIIETGIDKMILVRATKGGACTAFDFRRLHKDGSVEVFRVYDLELPAELKDQFEKVVANIAVEAEKHPTSIEMLKDQVAIFNAREKFKDAPEWQSILKKIKKGE